MARPAQAHTVTVSPVPVIRSYPSCSAKPPEDLSQAEREAFEMLAQTNPDTLYGYSIHNALDSGSADVFRKLIRELGDQIRDASAPLMEALGVETTRQIKILMTTEKNFQKIYTIQLNDEADSRFWYGKRVGEQFDAVLKVKECSDAVRPVFFIIQRDQEGRARQCAAVLTIRPEHCKVIKEEVEEVDSTFYEFARRSIVAKDNRRSS
jgi:hypothetical protein